MQNKFKEIEKLEYEYQIEAFDLGLTADQAQIITIHQYNYLVDVYNKVPKTQGAEIITQILHNKFEEIKNLKEKYQLIAFGLGLTAEEAQGISQYQGAFLFNALNKKNSTLGTSEEKENFVREKYVEIDTLRESHQIKALHLGLTKAQAQIIHPYDSDYLFNLYKKATNQGATFFAADTQKIFRKIEVLEEHQKTAFRRGISLLDAANLSQENVKNIEEIANGLIISSAHGETNNLLGLNQFTEGYKIFLHQQEEAFKAQATITSEVFGDDPPPPTNPTTRVNKRKVLGEDDDDTRLNKKTDSSRF